MVYKSNSGPTEKVPITLKVKNPNNPTEKTVITYKLYFNMCKTIGQDFTLW